MDFTFIETMFNLYEISVGRTVRWRQPFRVLAVFAGQHLLEIGPLYGPARKTKWLPGASLLQAAIGDIGNRVLTRIRTAGR